MVKILSHNIDFETVGVALVDVDFSTTGAKTINVGFRPRTVEFIHSRVQNGFNTTVQHATGFAVRGQGQRGNGITALSGAGAQQQYASTNSIAILPQSGGGTLTYEARITAWTDTGIVLNVITSGGYTGYFVLRE